MLTDVPEVFKYDLSYLAKFRDIVESFLRLKLPLGFPTLLTPNSWRIYTHKEPTYDVLPSETCSSISLRLLFLKYDYLVCDILAAFRKREQFDPIHSKCVDSKCL